MKFKLMIDAYTYWLEQLITKGKFNKLNTNIGTTEFKLLKDKVIRKNEVWVYGVITELPYEINIDITTILRKSLPKNVDVTIQTFAKRKDIDQTSKEMQRIKKIWEQSLSEKQTSVKRYKLNSSDDFKEVTQSNKAYDSWNLIFEHLSKGYQVADSEISFIVKFKKPIETSEIDKILFKMNVACQSVGVKILIIEKNLENLMLDYLPTIKPNINEPIHHYMTLLDGNFGVLEESRTGNVKGDKLFMGMNVHTGDTIFSDITTTNGGALNIFVIAQTGNGKTFYVKGLILSFIDIGIPTIIWDKDGEYTYYVKKLGGIVIELGSGNTYNTMYASSLKPTGLVDSIANTKAIIEIMAGENGLKGKRSYLFNLAYNKLKERYAIFDDDISSWENTKYLTYQEFYKELKLLRNDNSEDMVSSKQELDGLISDLYQFLDSGGMFKSFFDKPINMIDIIKEIENKPESMSISIDMQSKDKTGDSLDQLDRIKSYVMSFITNDIIDYYKSKEQLIALVIDESQRHVGNKFMVKSIKDEITHGRKRNLIPILITNGMGAYLHGDNPDLKDIRENMNMLIIGGVDSSTIDDICDTYKMEECKPVMHQMYLDNDPSNPGSYKNCFLTRINGEYYVLKLTLPEHISKGKLFKTRDA